ncbi:MAG: helix-turn-helix domain-containing protein [Armatimonadetes bacterium]|nr:helix-turn-helix domain-containing protein [Armatimonadota bacterium]
MPTRPADKLPAEHAHLAFKAWRSAPSVMPRAHTHTDLEFNIPLGGDLEYFFAGRFTRVPEGHFAVFWAGVPHRLTAQTATEYLCLTLPLAWFLAWRIAGGAFAGRLFAGELVSRPADGVELAQFTRWADDFSEPKQPARERIALLEVEACLRRVALETTTDAAPTPAQKITGGQAERIAARIGETFRDPELSVDAVADAVSLHPKYALAVFRVACGMTVWDYVTRLRVSHAQRLLLTTDWNMERIAHESGFASSGRFFVAFRKQTGGITPRSYRVQSG